jgi:hypothetical protein
MSLAAVIDALAERLRGGLPAGTQVGDAAPTGAQLPAVTISARDVTTSLVGVGRLPRGTRRGALRVVATIDLADPVLELDGDRVPLLRDDRLVLTLPHGQLVRADGTDDTPLDADDLTVTGPDGAFTVVAAAPDAGDVRPDPVTGTLTFGAPLPAAGTLTASYHLGQWDVETTRYAGVVDLAVSATDAAGAAQVARQVAALLDVTAAPFGRLQPTAWGPITLPPGDDDSPRVQVLAFGFGFELESPSLPSGGGLIRTVEVTVHRDEETEEFLVTREGSPA